MPENKTKSWLQSVIVMRYFFPISISATNIHQHTYLPFAAHLSRWPETLGFMLTGLTGHARRLWTFLFANARHINLHDSHRCSAFVRLGRIRGWKSWKYAPSRATRNVTLIEIASRHSGNDYHCPSCFDVLSVPMVAWRCASTWKCMVLLVSTKK